MKQLHRYDSVHANNTDSPKADQTWSTGEDYLVISSEKNYI